MMKFLNITKIRTEHYECLNTIISTSRVIPSGNSYTHVSIDDHGICPNGSGKGGNGTEHTPHGPW
jgi:hypothetical protein